MNLLITDVLSHHISILVKHLTKAQYLINNLSIKLKPTRIFYGDFIYIWS